MKKVTYLSKEQNNLVDQEIQEMLTKDGINKASRTSVNSKLFHSISTLQNESFTLSEILCPRKRFFM